MSNSTIPIAAASTTRMYVTVSKVKLVARINASPAALTITPSATSSHHLPVEALQIPAATVQAPAVRASMPRNIIMPFMANSRRVKVSAELRSMKVIMENTRARRPRKPSSHQFVMSVCNIQVLLLRLLVAQCVNRVKICGFAGRIITKSKSYQRRERHRQEHRAKANYRLPVGEPGNNSGRAMPTTMPTIPPAIERVVASTRNWVRISRVFAPTGSCFAMTGISAAPLLNSSLCRQPREACDRHHTRWQFDYPEVRVTG